MVNFRGEGIREGLEGEKRSTNRRRGGMGEDLGAGVEGMMDVIR